MELSRDVVVDLLPAYLSGEASAETRRLVESRMAGDPELARLVDEGREELNKLTVPPPGRKENLTMELEAVKRLALIRTLVLSALFSGVFLATLALVSLLVTSVRH